MSPWCIIPALLTLWIWVQAIRASIKMIGRSDELIVKLIIYGISAALTIAVWFIFLVISLIVLIFS